MATTGPSAPTTAPRADHHDQSEPATQDLCGIVPAAAAPVGRAELPAGVRLVPYGQIAGLTRPALVGTARRLRSSLLSYTDLLDQLATAWPVLPLRFGTTLPSATAVVSHVLAPHHDTFVRALAALGQRVQFTVRARYHPDAIVAEVLAERPDAIRLQRHGTGQAARLRLGELISQAVAGKRALDSNDLAHWLRPCAAAVALQPSTTMDLELLADAACLVDYGQQAGFEAAVAEVSRRWQGRVRLRLLGPMAAYHFADQLAGRGRS